MISHCIGKSASTLCSSAFSLERETLNNCITEWRTRRTPGQFVSCCASSRSTSVSCRMLELQQVKSNKMEAGHQSKSPRCSWTVKCIADYSPYCRLFFPWSASSSHTYWDIYVRLPGDMEITFLLAMVSWLAGTPSRILEVIQNTIHDPSNLCAASGV